MSGLEGWRARWATRLQDSYLETGAPLASHTTLRVGGPADLLATVHSVDDLVLVVREAWDQGVEVVILGGGSNVLVADEGIRGVVVINRCRRWRIFTGDDGKPRAWAASGVPLAGLARTLVRRGLDGLTWAVHIPGTVGGAVVGNAGAHGGCIATVIEVATVLMPDGRVYDLSPDELAYGYRTSCLKQAIAAGGPAPVVLAATFRLEPKSRQQLEAEAEGFLAYRRRTQPAEPSVGSIFRNPPGDFAGRLIEAAGLKGVRLGGAQVSPVHANFIVNTGGATARDIEALMRHVREHVYAQFGVWLVPEIVFLGDWPATVYAYWQQAERSPMPRSP